jgi:uncharacterized protein (TIGR02270 family)
MYPAHSVCRWKRHTECAGYIAMPAPTLNKVIEKHIEELGFLWGQRTAAVRSPDWKLPEVQRLDRRIEAHLDGLIVAAKADLAAFELHLKAEDPGAVTAAAAALLQVHTPEAAKPVVDSLLTAEPDKIDSIRRALLHGPIDLIEQPLRAAAESGPPHVAGAAMEALLYHGCKNVPTGRLAELVRHEDPAIRCAAWRIFALQ